MKVVNKVTHVKFELIPYGTVFSMGSDIYMKMSGGAANVKTGAYFHERTEPERFNNIDKTYPYATLLLEPSPVVGDETR